MQNLSQWNLRFNAYFHYNLCQCHKSYHAPYQSSLISTFFRHLLTLESRLLAASGRCDLQECSTRVRRRSRSRCWVTIPLQIYLVCRYIQMCRYLGRGDHPEQELDWGRAHGAPSLYCHAHERSREREWSSPFILFWEFQTIIMWAGRSSSHNQHYFPPHQI